MKNFKKTIVGLLTLCLLLSCFCVTTVFADETDGVITVFVDGNQLEFDVNPITENDRTLVPLRGIFEALGATVTWDEPTQTATAVKGSDTMCVTIDSNMLYKNGEAVELDVPARMVGDRTLVPVRAVSESFDATVEWDEELQKVIITTNQAVLTPTPAPTAAATSAPTASPEATASSEIFNADTLSDDDMNTLKTKKEIIRYQFEQTNMPEYVFENSSDIYNMITNNQEDFSKQVKNVWNETVASAIIDIQLESEFNYVFDDAFFDKLSNADSYLDVYGDIFEDSGLEAENFISDIYYAYSDNGTAAAVIEFESADSLVQCKYLSVVAKKGGEPKYFTAENDLVDTESWYFCQVTETSRWTITKFDKDSNAMDTFIKYSFAAYEE